MHTTSLPRRPLALTALAVALLAALAPLTHTYRGENAGVVVGTAGYSLGFEWRGSPGLFAHLDGTDPDHP
ncbi:hypothetical protein ACH4UT_23685 [Streptomyces sp. NPDC020799]|uniref:hypothetical protein n=1 Tax=Streptomyces sp. NPDC020799 TaxID=3365091 RepID=UPI00346D5382